MSCIRSGIGKWNRGRNPEPKVSSKSEAAAAVAVMLIGATAFATDSAFATKRENNQAFSQVNDCGNGEFPENVGSQNTASQIQGDENEIAIVTDQLFL